MFQYSDITSYGIVEAYVIRCIQLLSTLHTAVVNVIWISYLLIINVSDEYYLYRGRVMVFKAVLSNISAISWRLCYVYLPIKFEVFRYKYTISMKMN
jgi:hypothetical protein